MNDDNIFDKNDEIEYVRYKDKTQDKIVMSFMTMKLMMMLIAMSILTTKMKRMMMIAMIKLRQDCNVNYDNETDDGNNKYEDENDDVDFSVKYDNENDDDDCNVKYHNENEDDCYIVKNN
jgi:hypothetical protein